jgi:predicted DNA-binding protein (MmcQ/YjbR family)
MTITGEQLQHIARSAANALPGVSHGRPFVDKLDVYKVAQKVFLIVTDDPDELIITVKTEPDFGRSLQRSYESIGQGRYLNKAHWISVGAGREITVELIEDLVAHSYELVLDSVPRSRRPRGVRNHGPGPLDADSSKN